VNKLQHCWVQADKQTNRSQNTSWLYRCKNVAAAQNTILGIVSRIFLWSRYILPVSQAELLKGKCTTGCRNNQLPIPYFVKQTVSTSESLLVTWCNNGTINNCTLCSHIIFVIFIYLRINSDLCHLQHKLIGFYYRDEKCLLGGMGWAFK
jgi:hypothetical protein